MATFTRFYLAPKVGVGESTDPFRPKHFVDADGLSWIAGTLTCQDDGPEPSFFVTAEMTGAEHAKIVRTAADVVVLHPKPEPHAPLPEPPSLDTPVGDYAEVLWDRLEAHGFPALWIEPETPMRAVIRFLQQRLHLAQRLAPGARLFPPGITLDSHVLNLTPAQRQHLIDAVVAGGGTGDGLLPTMTLRTAITYLASQLPYPPTLLDVAL